MWAIWILSCKTGFSLENFLTRSAARSIGHGWFIKQRFIIKPFAYDHNLWLTRERESNCSRFEPTPRLYSLTLVLFYTSIRPNIHHPKTQKTKEKETVKHQKQRLLLDMLGRLQVQAIWSKGQSLRKPVIQHYGGRNKVPQHVSWERSSMYDRSWNGEWRSVQLWKTMPQLL